MGSPSLICRLKRNNQQRVRITAQTLTLTQPRAEGEYGTKQKGRGKGSREDGGGAFCIHVTWAPGMKETAPIERVDRTCSLREMGPGQPGRWSG